MLQCIAAWENIENSGVRTILRALCGMCSSVLQCVAVCCSVLQCVAVCCSVLQYVAVCCSVCSVLQCVAVWEKLEISGVHLSFRAPCGMCNSALHCFAVCCSMLQYVAVCCSVGKYRDLWRAPKFLRSVRHVQQCVAVCYSVLQYVAVCCSMLQYGQIL